MTAITKASSGATAKMSTQRAQNGSRKASTRREPVNWDQELRWLQKNRWVLVRYKGEWVAIQENKVIAHNPNYQALQKACLDKMVQTPFVQYIPCTDEEWDLGRSNHVIPKSF